MNRITEVQGLQMKHLLPTERLAACCIRCDRFLTGTVETLKLGFLPHFPVWWLENGMTVYCQARKTGEGECGRWFVSPDMGCSDVG